MGRAGDDERLVAAVRAGDAEEVRRLPAVGADPDTLGEDGLPVLCAAVAAFDADVAGALVEAGADPDARTEDGLPVLCAAVAAYDAETARALVAGGADPDRELPDGTTPLYRAIDGGSPAVVDAVLGPEPRLRLPETARERLLALARRWYESGVEAELRRAPGASGPARTVLVEDSEDSPVRQVTLGGRTVREGHGAILTSLEWAFRVLTPVDALVARAVTHPDAGWEHPAWSAARCVLSERRSRETWSALAAYRHHPDPAHRRFAVEALWSVSVFRWNHGDSYERDTAELLADWALEEPDDGVLTQILRTFNYLEHPGHEELGLRFAGHAHPLVRVEAACALADEDVPLTPAARAALLGLAGDPDALVRAAAGEMLADRHDLSDEVTGALLALVADPDADVRRKAAAALATSRDRSPAVVAALWALLDEDDQSLRLEGAFGLARRDDPRTEEAYRRVGPLVGPLAGPESEHDHRPTELLHHRWRLEGRSATAET
ncbi:HEAT repeat domain-containing protein [Streptomyces sp. NBC_01353]|uniref:HEAT repeat domain-containing protein n=1 Tax=Streptomyces sp. NBC_01353 TaxID=2903835 RepID=UPI002E3591BE|nr:HEAT repeat domain-containing protein [Streptomyces sp. NBC_01353]